jgi:diaminohydroxyphosphoribosylaminopyrimidine deaminase/5-amino-6-(5-phosphoribosylamino)uracil reductase
VSADDPLLTARPSGLRAATRVVLTASGDLPETCRLRTTAREVPVLVFTANAAKLAGWSAGGAEVIGLPAGDGGVSVDAVLAELGRRRMTNVLVEGGAGVLGAFFDANAVDEAWVFVAPKVLGEGAAAVAGRGVERIASALRAADTSVERIADDVLFIARLS